MQCTKKKEGKNDFPIYKYGIDTWLTVAGGNHPVNIKRLHE